MAEPHSCKARKWFAFRPKSASSLLESSEERNIASKAKPTRSYRRHLFGAAFYLDENNGRTTSRKARMWFAFQPQSVSSLLVNRKCKYLAVRQYLHITSPCGCPSLFVGVFDSTPLALRANGVLPLGEKFAAGVPHRIYYVYNLLARQDTASGMLHIPSADRQARL